MIVTLKEIVDARDALMTLSSQKLPIKASYNVSKIIRKANEELELLSKERDEIISRHTGLAKGTAFNMNELSPEVVQVINNDLRDAMEISVELPINKVDLSNLNTLEITARDVSVLDPFCIFDSTDLT